MVVFPIELYQSRLEVDAHAGKDSAQVVQNGLGEHFATILRHKDQVDVHEKYSMPAAANIGILSWIVAHSQLVVT